MPVKDRFVPASSRRDVDADPGQQATPATRLQTLACSGGTPTPSNAEYDTSEVTPPAAPTAPATTPAAINTTTSPVPGTAASVARPAPMHGRTILDPGEHGEDDRWPDKSADIRFHRR